MGAVAKDGAYLYLNDFRKKIEHVGVWRKDGPSNKWTRLPVAGKFTADLAGVGDIAIEA